MLPFLNEENTNNQASAANETDRANITIQNIITESTGGTGCRFINHNNINDDAVDLLNDDLTNV